MEQSDQMTWIDYTIFVLMLIFSTTVGLYHGILKNKPNTIDEYLFAGRNLPAIPIILSNMARGSVGEELGLRSFINNMKCLNTAPIVNRGTVSSIGIVGMSRESYYYGMQMLFMQIGHMTGYVCFYFFYVPVFYELKYTSYFEYLEKRFNKTVRLLGSGVVIIAQVIHALIVMYSACTAVTKVIPIPFYILTTVVCWLCTVYTFLGGLRGVVWSDFIQALFMYGSMITIIIVSVVNVGGVNKAIDIVGQGGRLNFFNFDPSPFSRHSTWLLWITGFSSSLGACTSPAIIQRCLSVSNFKKLKIILISSALSHFTHSAMVVITGLLMYATYQNCDPFLNKELKDADQLITYHVLKIGRNLPGLSGLFLAGILSASLSTLSTIMNTLSGNILEDFIKLVPVTLNNARTNLYLKIIVVLLGLIVNGGIFALNSATGIMQMSITLLSFAGGLKIFLFSFGLFIRNANIKGVIIGALTGSLITVWMSLGSMWSIAAGKIKYTTKIVSTEGCVGNVSHIFVNMTRGSPYSTPVIFDPDVPYLYRISFNLFITIGLIVSFSVGTLIILCTKPNENLNEKLLIPQIRRNSPDSYECVPCTDLENNSQVF